MKTLLKHKLNCSASSLKLVGIGSYSGYFHAHRYFTIFTTSKISMLVVLVSVVLVNTLLNE